MNLQELSLNHSLEYALKRCSIQAYLGCYDLA